MPTTNLSWPVHYMYRIRHRINKSVLIMIMAKSHATATGHQGMLIITGGKDDKGNTLSTTELFDSYNGQWYVPNDLPQPHFWLQSVIVRRDR